MIKHYFIAACTAAAYFASAAAVAAATGQAGENLGQLIVRGEYLARTADCVACHTASGGKPFAGGLPMATPVGTVYSSNITPDKSNGIGNYTEAEFDQALRHGVRKDGASLYPAMPYDSFAKVKPADVKALYAYFMSGVQPEATPNRAADIPWPLSMRWPLRIWRAAFAPAVAVAGDDGAISDSSSSAQIAQGRYLVEGLGHCGACHTPRGVAMQEKALGDDGSQLFLSGAAVDGFLASNLRGDGKDGLGKWTEQDIVAFLKSGRNAHSAAFGGMTDVINNSTGHMNDDDLLAIAKYLKSLGPVRPGDAAPVYDETTHAALRTGTDHSNGAMTFLNNCAACHRSSGHGVDQTFPALALSPTVNAKDPASLIKLALQGAVMPGTETAPTQFGMPGFADRLSDGDVADVLTYIRSSWGNNAPAVTADMVAKVRKTLPKKLADSSAATPH